MGERRRYRIRPDRVVTAVRLDLDLTPSGGSLRYRKWGAEQRCKQGDWIVDNEGDVYSVDANTFARTYERVSPGVYHKRTRVWAEVASEAGSVETLEGRSHYEAGDYVVSNQENGGDSYCIGAAKFESMYDLDE